MQNRRFFFFISNQSASWLLFIALCFIWGSSFILMKAGMFTPAGKPLLNAWQVASLRIFFSGLVMLPFAIRAWSNIPVQLRAITIFSGWLGSFVPAVLFCVAESKIDSGLAATLNAMTPLFTILIAWGIFRNAIAAAQWWGIILGLAGCVLLFLSGAGGSSAYPWFAALVVIATLCYGWNVNMVRHKLQGINALDIASVAFVTLIPFSFVLLYVSGYFRLPLEQLQLLKATGAAVVLGVVGTALASVIFYKLVARAGVVFASLVTYGIPFVAFGWGVYYGEKITAAQIGSLGLILAGVYLANRVKSTSKKAS